MRQVTIYQCEYCNKYFKTPNKHKCKYDPVSKNCYSCEFNKGFSEQEDVWYGYNGSENYRTTISVDCEKGHERYANDKHPCNAYKYAGCNWYENKHNKPKEDGD